MPYGYHHPTALPLCGDYPPDPADEVVKLKAIIAQLEDSNKFLEETLASLEEQLRNG